MNILLLSNYFPPTHTAGTEKRTLGYAKNVQKLGHNVQVVCAGKWDEGERYWNGEADESYLGIPIKRIYLNWALAPDPNQYLYRNPVIAKEMENWLHNFQPDIIHVTSCYTLSASIIEKAKDFGLPIVLTLTDFWFICPKQTLLRSDGSLCNGRTSPLECQDCLMSGNRTYRQIVNYVPRDMTIKSLNIVSRNRTINKIRGLRGVMLNMDDRKEFLEHIIHVPNEVIAPSQYLANMYASSGVSRKIRVIQSGHDLSWLNDYNGKTPTNRIRFGYVGQIAPSKGIHILISAYSQIMENNTSELVIYGDLEKDPIYTDYLLTLIKKSRNKIKIAGSFPHNELGKVLSGIDILIVPSMWHENNPRVIQEGFASHTPVIASDVGGISEFVQHEVNGLLFERGNKISLYEQMSKVIKDPQLVEQLGSRIEPVKTIEKEVDEIIDIYQDLILLNGSK